MEKKSLVTFLAFLSSMNKVNREVDKKAVLVARRIQVVYAFELEFLELELKP